MIKNQRDVYPNVELKLAELRPHLPKIILAGAVLVAVLLLGFELGQNTGSSNSSTDNRLTLRKANATTAINKTLDISIKDSTGKEVTRLSYVLTTADLRDEIIVNGQKATAVKGKSFLIINIKITNSYSKAVDVNARDFVRLMIGGDKDNLKAPDIHNDPVTVQAISTKDIRVGFPINDADKSKLALQLGEINGDKQTTPLKF